MKKKIIGIFLSILIVVGTFTFVVTANTKKTIVTNNGNSGDLVDHTLITELGYNSVIEVDIDGNIIWEKTGLMVPVDAERLNDGNTLIVESAIGKVIEVNSTGDIVWELSLSNTPSDAERLNNGNTLVSLLYGEFVLEFDSDGYVVWSYYVILPCDVERLDNGNTLIVKGGFDVIEVDSYGNIVWEKTGLNLPMDAERLDNGNTLITEYNGSRVIEVDINGDIIWEKTGLNSPNDAERLENGNTLIAETNGHRVIEVDINGNIVWEYIVGAPFDVERFTIVKNQPPDTPNISGPDSGKVGTSYEFAFNSTDPDEDDIAEYIVDWGDGTGQENITGPFPSGEVASANHTWYSEGTYTIQAKAKDINGAESNWSEFEVNMPRSKEIDNPLLRFFENYPLLCKIFQLLFK